jgi:hypothetical protein
MKNLGKWMLGAAIVAGGLGLGANTAQAAEFRVVIGGPRAYIPPCPGPGYVWVNGYYDGGYWVPGRWNYAAVGFRGDRAYYGHVDRDRRFYSDRDDHRRSDRDDHRGHDGDRYRH